MARDLSPLDTFLDEGEYDGYLLHAGGDESDQRYLSGFDAPDPYTTLYDGAVHLLVSTLEYGRAKKESDATDVARLADYDYQPLAAEHGSEEAFRRVVAAFLADHGVESAAVPGEFPVGLADGLREQGVSVTAETSGVLVDIRAVKTETEIEYIRQAQAANDAAMGEAERLLREAEVGERGVCYHDGEPLTSERIRTAIEMALLRRGYALDETIVACGADAADPHDRGSGPIRANEPVIVDIFPRGKASGYFADMTRTFVKGTPTPEIEAWYDLTQAAKEAALAAVEPGATGEAVHDAVCDVYEEAGETTLRADPTAETGFIHSTGHGVGLDIHERPRIGPGGEELTPGMAITIEPGLYDPAIGGVRIEDLVVVTDDGYENLTDYPEVLVVD